MTERGSYIVFEGGEHVGKTTQVQLMADKFGALEVREPGTTELGKKVREILLFEKIVSETKAGVLLHAAQRAELMSSVVQPALDTGRNVISDRSWISGGAYQSAQGVSLEEIIAVNQFALGDRQTPDLLILLDANPEDVLARADQAPDNYEKLGLGFHQEVAGTLRTLSSRFGGVVIDATAEIEVVSSQISAVIEDHLRV